MPIIKKSNEKLIDYCGCYSVEKSFPIVPIGYLAVDLGIKWEAFTAVEATEKKSQAWTFVVSSS